MPFSGGKENENKQVDGNIVKNGAKTSVSDLVNATPG
jgi:hypothetical protein